MNKKPRTYCPVCNKQLGLKNKSGYCNKHRDRTGQNNPFYRKTHTKQTIQKARVKCVEASKKLWQNEEYRNKVIKGTSKPRSEQGKLNISSGVKRSYDQIEGLRDSRRFDMKKTWQDGRMNQSSYNINKSKAQYQIGNLLSSAYPSLEIELKGSIKYSQNGKNKWIFPDILVKQYNIVIQYYGDYWHMNPLLCNQNDINKRTKTTAKDCWDFDKKRQNLFSNLGYNIYVIWQYDFQNHKEQTLNKLFSFIEGVINANSQG